MIISLVDIYFINKSSAEKIGDLSQIAAVREGECWTGNMNGTIIKHF